MKIPAMMLAALVWVPSFIFAAPESEPEDYQILKEIIVLEFANAKPHEAGPVVSGMMTRIKTPEKVMAVTFNVCGKEGAKVDVDAALLDFLEKEGIPATFFVSGIWIEKNPELFKRMVGNSLFEIANLGLEAKSCLVRSEQSSETPATQSAEEVFVEIEKNARKIEARTGVLPHFFRSAQAYYDDVAVRIARALGYEVIGDSFASTGAHPGNVADRMLMAASGSIASFSLNFEGQELLGIFRQIIPALRTKGFKFVRLDDYPLE